jgi:hypothetical protein
LDTDTVKDISKNSAQSSIFAEIRPIIIRAKKKAQENGENLEEILDIDRSTLWRWENGTNKKSMRPDHLLKLLKYDSEVKTIDQVKNVYKAYKTISDYLTASFPMSLTEKHLENEDAVLISDTYEFYVYYICGTLRGASIHELVNTIGNIAAKKAEIPDDIKTEDLINSMGFIAYEIVSKLIDKGVLEKKGDLIVRRKTDTFISIKNGLERALNLIQDFVSPERWKEGHTSFYMYQESIPVKIAAEIATESAEFHKKIRDKMDYHRSTSPDAVPYFFSTCAEKLYFTDSNSNERVIQ